MKKQCFFTSLMILLGILCIPLVANAYDLTTFGDASNGDAFQGRLARYTTCMGSTQGNTAIQDVSQGLYDYISYPRSSKPTWRMNNGVINDSTTVNTYAGNDDYALYFSGENGYPESFFGYKFKQAATVESLTMSQFAYSNGGTFETDPRVEVMDASGTWTTATVTWDVGYDSSFGAGSKVYNLTFNSPATDVWGVRVIGDAKDSPGASDPNGFVSVGELKVNGAMSIMDDIDLTTNLALGQTPIWTTTGSGYSTQKGTPEKLTDGNCGVRLSGSYDYDTTYNNAGFSASEEFAGVLFENSQSNVTAVGAVMVMFSDGGYITSDTLRVEYLEQGGDWTDSADWHAVSGLDLGSYGDNYAALQTVASAWRYGHSELLDFDTITSPIDGLRMIGSVPSPSGSDTDGFLGMLEFEVFAAQAAVPEPSTIVLLLGACLIFLPRLMCRKGA